MGQPFDGGGVGSRKPTQCPETFGLRRGGGENVVVARALPGRREEQCRADTRPVHLDSYLGHFQGHRTLRLNGVRRPRTIGGRGFPDVDLGIDDHRVTCADGFVSGHRRTQTTRSGLFPRTGAISKVSKSVILSSLYWSSCFCRVNGQMIGVPTFWLYQFLPSE